MSMETFCLMDERVAIVTGGARGIGRAIVEKLAHLGANVVIADMLLDLAEKSADEIEKSSTDIVEKGLNEK